MDCERLQNLIKTWYFQVQDEALAPARMVAFMTKHITECSVCLNDPVVKQEVEKISAHVLPPSKIPKAVKEAQEKEEEEVYEADTEDEDVDEDEENDVDDEEDDDEYDNDDDDDDEDDMDPEDFDTLDDDDDVD